MSTRIFKISLLPSLPQNALITSFTPPNINSLMFPNITAYFNYTKLLYRPEECMQTVNEPLSNSSCFWIAKSPFRGPWILESISWLISLNFQYQYNSTCLKRYLLFALIVSTAFKSQISSLNNLRVKFQS